MGSPQGRSPRPVRLFRVLDYDANAGVEAPGGAKYVPPQGSGRLDNPEAYEILYTCRQAAGAIAERFRRGPYLHRWHANMLRPPIYAPSSARALVTYDLPGSARICDLDDGKALADRAIRPSRVVSVDYSVTQAWALSIHGEGRWSGIGWWSRMDSRWANVAVWNVAELIVLDIEPLRLDLPALVEAAGVLDIEIT